jgi:phage tail sheath gpL-like
MGSNAISQNAVAALVAFLLKKGYFATSSPNLPQSISIFGQANTANQPGLSTTPVQITSAKQAATLYGYGSPIHSVARILFPQSGANVNIPVYAFPQLAAGGAVAKVLTVTPTGTATAPGTVIMNIAGRATIDGGSYAINIETGDDPTAICNKMRTAVAAALACPILGTGTSTFIGTAKFKGLESNDIKITIDLNGSNTGVTFAVANTTAGSGTASVASSLALIGNEWKTLLINTYGFVETVLDEFEAWNGIPDNNTPTGRYSPSIWMPAFALTGSTLDDPTSLTSANERPANVTIVPCVAPLSEGLPYEAAANVAYLLGNVLQNTPHGDVIGTSYPDMPGTLANVLPQMNGATFREYCVTHGCSTVDYANGRYTIRDLVTTYNVSGEFPPFYRWVRDLNIYWNIKFGEFLIIYQKLIGKTLVNDDAVVTVSNVTKPKMIKADLSAYIDDLEARALITDKKFSKDGLTVGISTVNPNRVDSSYPVKISGLARQSANDVIGGFNFGS